MSDTSDTSGSAGARRFESLVRRLMPHDAFPVEVCCGGARVRIGAEEPMVRLVIRDRAALRRHLFRCAPLVALALAYADGALDIEGDILLAARIKDNMPQRGLTPWERLRVALELWRW